MYKKQKKIKHKGFIREIFEIAILVVIALLFRSVLYEPYVVPSTSMVPNLLVGDRLLVEKFSYGISKYSFPLSPDIFKGRIFAIQKPKRGDIVVFETDKVYVKRLIGLPGDTIQVLGGQIYINSNPVKQKEISKTDLPQYLEILSNGVKYKVLDEIYDSYYDNTGKYIVPEGHYFFMGDNRDYSSDSRNLEGIGFVPYENLLGKVRVILFSSPEVRWYNPAFLFSLNKDRFWKKV